MRKTFGFDHHRRSFLARRIEIHRFHRLNMLLQSVLLVVNSSESY